MYWPFVCNRRSYLLNPLSLHFTKISKPITLRGYSKVRLGPYYRYCPLRPGVKRETVKVPQQDHNVIVKTTPPDPSKLCEYSSVQPNVFSAHESFQSPSKYPFHPELNR